MSCLSFTLLVLFVPGLLTESSNFKNVTCDEKSGFYRDPRNCSNFYQCSFGKPTDLKFCPYELVFSNSIKNCVEKGSQYDDCNREIKMINPMQTIEQRCKNGEKVIHHPNLCSAYYNCSNKNTELRGYLQECPYPMLFSLRTFNCEPFERVQCGVRREPKYACDYIKNGCPFSHCRPCWLRFAECKGDAKYAQIKPWSSKFTRCFKGRSMNTEVCPERIIFDPIREQCVDDVRVEVSNQKIPCSKQGYNPDKNDCTKFYFCEMGSVSLIIQCQFGNVYNPKTGSCSSPNDVCRPCGKKICK